MLAEPTFVSDSTHNYQVFLNKKKTPLAVSCQATQVYIICTGEPSSNGSKKNETKNLISIF